MAQAARNRIRLSHGDGIFNIVNVIIVTIVLIAVLYPIIYVVSASFSSASALVAGEVLLLPVKPTLAGYKALLTYRGVARSYLNSFFYGVSFTLLSAFLTLLAAYPLSRKDFMPRNVIMFIFSFTMWFGGGMIPSYLVVRDLHLLNTPWACIIPGAMGVYNTIIMRTFIQSNIPDELLESAKLDGCSDIRFLVSIVLPLSGAVIAVVMLYCFVGNWNSYMGAFLYLSNRELFPLQLILREVLVMSQMMSVETDISMNAAYMSEEQAMEIRYLSELLKYSLIVASSLPLILAYPFAQRYFMKGVMIGAIKG